MVYLRWILPTLLFPVAITLICVLSGLLFRRPALIWGGLAILWICSTPLFSGRLVRFLEAGAIRQPASAAPTGDAIVVLSTGRVIAPGPAHISEWVDPDRFFAGLDLFRAGKAPKLIFTGGWSPLEAGAPLEGNVLRQYALTSGIPASGIEVTGRVSTTAEEADSVAAMLRASAPASAPRVILVTSAFHMYRARRAFEAKHLSVFPFPVDFRGSAGSGNASILALVPSAAALDGTEMAMRELYGRAFYWLAGKR